MKLPDVDWRAVSLYERVKLFQRGLKADFLFFRYGDTYSIYFSDAEYLGQIYGVPRTTIWTPEGSVPAAHFSLDRFRLAVSGQVRKGMVIAVSEEGVGECTIYDRRTNELLGL